MGSWQREQREQRCEGEKQPGTLDEVQTVRMCGEEGW